MVQQVQQRAPPKPQPPLQVPLIVHVLVLVFHHLCLSIIINIIVIPIDYGHRPMWWLHHLRQNPRRLHPCFANLRSPPPTPQRQEQHHQERRQQRQRIFMVEGLLLHRQRNWLEKKTKSHRQKQEQSHPPHSQKQGKTRHSLAYHIRYGLHVFV